MPRLQEPIDPRKLGYPDSEGLLTAYMRGVAIRQQQEEAERRREDQEIQREELKIRKGEAQHRLKAFDLEQRKRERDEKIEKFRFMETQPGQEEEEVMPEGVAGPPSMKVKGHDPVEIPGVGTFQPRTLQEVLKQQLEQKKQDIALKDEYEGVPIGADIPELGYTKGQRVHPQELSARATMHNRDESAMERAEWRNTMKADRDSARTAAAADKETARKMDAEKDLRKEYETRIKPFRDAENALTTIKGLGKRGTAANDLAVLYKFVKSMDDTAAREGELALAQQAQSVWGNIQTWMSRASSDPRLLTDATVKQFVKAAEDIYRQMEGLRGSVDSEFQGIAERQGLDFRNINLRAGAKTSEEEEYDAVYDPKTRKFVTKKRGR